MAGHVNRGKQLGPVNRGDIDVGALFEKYTIDGIREIEKKTRQDIEKKKEDLRQMVGERYRDLIEAADTITEMKRSSDSVMESIARIQDLCNNLKQSFATSHRTTSIDKSKDSARKSQQRSQYSTAVNLKLLMDMPEQIWSALDSGHYLMSTRLYLVARHIYNTIQLDPQAMHTISRFPLLSRQWTSICHFRTTILQTCRARLKDSSLSDEDVGECLCSILLLEDYTSEEVFNEFLSVRSDAVQQLFFAEKTDSSVRSQVCSIFSLIVTTIHQIYTIFHIDDVSSGDTDNPVKCNLLMKILKEVTSKSETGNIINKDEISVPSQRYLSKSVVDFRPSPRHQIQPVSLAVLRKASQQFLDRCTRNVRDGLVKLLGYVTSVKGLTAVRDELWQLMKMDNRLSTWDAVCQPVLGRSLHIWMEFAAEIFISRVEELLQAQFYGMVVAGKAQINKVLADLTNIEDRLTQHERDLSSYVWTESAQDMPCTSSINSFMEQSALMMKTRGYTPAVQSLCRGVDQRLKILLDDANHYVCPQANQPLPASHSATEDQPFDRYADKKRVHEFLQNACESCITKQLDHLQLQLNEGRQQLTKSKNELGNQIIIYRILLMGRFTSALCELSSHLQLCMCCQLGDELPPSAITRLAAKKAAATKALSKTLEGSRWFQLRDQLTKFSSEAYSVWTEYVSQLLINQFKTTLGDKSGSNILHSCTQWDCIEIEEETEDSKMVKSTIRVPMQASWYVQTLLYNLCEDINKMGGQTMPVSSRSNLVQQLSIRILDTYDQLLDTSVNDTALSQVQSLQWLFDLRFLMTILGYHKDDAETNSSVHKRLQKIIEKLESYVDPFDLDVFYPYIQNHLARQTQRSTVLYGSLTSADKRAVLYGGSSTLGTQQEQHNVLPLSSCQNRFPLLPLSMQSRLTTSTATTIQPIVQPPKSKTNPMPGASLNSAVPENILPPARMTSSSFLEQMSTIWFSQVGSK